MKLILIICLFIVGIQGIYDSSMYVTQLDGTSYQTEVVTSVFPWFIHFERADCKESCHESTKQFEKAAKYLIGKVKFAYIDIKNDLSLAKKLGVGGEIRVIFLNSGAKKYPMQFNKNITVDELESFYYSEQDMTKVRQIYDQEEENIRVLKSVADFEKYVVKSPDPWFILFCSGSHPQRGEGCNQAVMEEYLASDHLKGIIKFGYVDVLLDTGIPALYGISGFGVVIFLDRHKPLPYGIPWMVQGSSVMDYEKFAWDTIGRELKLEEKFSPKLEDISQQQFEFLRQDGQAFFILFYSNAVHYSKPAEYRKLSGIMLEAQKIVTDPRIIFARYNVDVARGIVGALNVWPLPHIFYVPLKWKGSESLVSYEQDFSPESMKTWLEQQIKEDEINNLKFVTGMNFDQVLNSNEPWFILFYTLDKLWCRQCRFLIPTWKELSKQELIIGKVNIAKFNCDTARPICEKFASISYPSMQFYPSGARAQKHKVEYKGITTMPEDIAGWAHDQWLISSLKEIIELETEENFNQYCTLFNGNCFIALLPPGGARYLTILNKVSEKYIEKAVSFSWIEGGTRVQFEKTFRHTKETGYPTLVALNFKRGVQNGYKVHKGEFSFDEIDEFVKGLVSEERAFIPLRKQIIFTDQIQQEQQQDL